MEYYSVLLKRLGGGGGWNNAICSHMDAIGSVSLFIPLLDFRQGLHVADGGCFSWQRWASCQTRPHRSGRGPPGFFAGKALLSVGVTAWRWGEELSRRRRKACCLPTGSRTPQSSPWLAFSSECPEGPWGYSANSPRAINQRWRLTPLQKPNKNSAAPNLLKCSDTHTIAKANETPKYSSSEGN